MKALYRVSDGWIFNAPCDCDTLTETEVNHIEIDKIWALIDIPEGIEYPKDYMVENDTFVLLPEEQRHDYVEPEEDI